MRRLLASPEIANEARQGILHRNESRRQNGDAALHPASSVTPKTDPKRGIVGFEISWSSGTKSYLLDRVVYLF
jgi:hypothetical protein